MADWQPYCLADLVDVKHGFAFDGAYFKDMPPGDILLTPGNFAIGGGFQAKRSRFYDGPVPKDFVLKPGDLLVTMTDLSKDADTLGFPAIIPEDGRRYLHNQRLGKVTLRPGAPTTLQFVQWVLRTQEYRHEVIASSSGSTVKHTSPTRIMAYRFLLPPLHEQAAISTILGALDNKIDLNRSMNDTLEAVARAIFKDWFVDFGPTRAKMEGRASYLSPDVWSLFPDRLDDGGKPVGWNEAPLSSISDVIMGASPDGSTYNDLGIGVPLVNGPVEYGDFFLRRVKWTTTPTRLSERGDFIICVRGSTTGRHAFADGVYCLGRGVGEIRAHCGHQVFINQLILMRLSELLQKTTGSVFPSLASDDIRSFRSLLPSLSTRELYCKTVGPTDDRIWKNTEENEALVSTRDFLLPKLMSGEIRIKAAEKVLEDVL